MPFITIANAEEVETSQKARVFRFVLVSFERHVAYTLSVSSQLTIEFRTQKRIKN